MDDTMIMVPLNLQQMLTFLKKNYKHIARKNAYLKILVLNK